MNTPNRERSKCKGPGTENSLICLKDTFVGVVKDWVV